MSTPPTQSDEVIRLSRPSPARPQTPPAAPPRAPKQISFAAVFALSSIVSAMWITLIGLGFLMMSDYRIVSINRVTPDAELSAALSDQLSDQLADTNEQIAGLRDVLSELVDTADLTTSERASLDRHLNRGLHR